MSDVLTQLDHLALPPASGAIEGRSPWQLAWARLRRDRVALTCAVAIVLITLVAIFAPVISMLVGHGPETQYLDIGLTPEGLPRGPSAQFLFGTDDLGRDVLVRVAYGARVSLLVSVVASCIAVFLGVVVGVTSGYFGGALDSFLARFDARRAR